MGRYAALIALALAVTLPAAAAKKKTSSSKEKTTKEKRAPHSLKLRSIDLQRRVLLVEIGGFRKPPAPNLFRMTNSRERHFIAVTVSCEPPFPSGVRVCEVALPEGYERHRLVSLELHVGGLKSKMIAATPGEVESAWTAAQLAKQDARTPSPVDGGVKDGGR